MPSLALSFQNMCVRSEIPNRLAANSFPIRSEIREGNKDMVIYLPVTELYVCMPQLSLRVSVEILGGHERLSKLLLLNDNFESKTSSSDKSFCKMKRCMTKKTNNIRMLTGKGSRSSS